MIIIIIMSTWPHHANAMVGPGYECLLVLDNPAHTPRALPDKLES